MNKLKEMFSRVLEIFGSVRFWFMVSGAVMLYLKQTGIITPELADAIMVVLFGVPGVGTLDKFSQAMKSTKK